MAGPSMVGYVLWSRPPQGKIINNQESTQQGPVGQIYNPQDCPQHGPLGVPPFHKSAPPFEGLDYHETLSSLYMIFFKTLYSVAQWLGKVRSNRSIPTFHKIPGDSTATPLIIDKAGRLEETPGSIIKLLEGMFLNDYNHSQNW